MFNKSIKYEKEREKRKKTNISFEQWNSIFLIAKKRKKLRKNVFVFSFKTS